MYYQHHKLAIAFSLHCRSIRVTCDSRKFEKKKKTTVIMRTGDWGGWGAFPDVVRQFLTKPNSVVAAGTSTRRDYKNSDKKSEKNKELNLPPYMIYLKTFSYNIQNNSYHSHRSCSTIRRVYMLRVCSIHIPAQYCISPWALEHIFNYVSELYRF